MTTIDVYGKKDCSLCHSAKKKISLMLSKWQLDEQVPVVFRDMETVEGAAEGDYFDVHQIPTVLLMQDGEHVLARWDGKPPASKELQQRLTA